MVCPLAGHDRTMAYCLATSRPQSGCQGRMERATKWESIPACLATRRTYRAACCMKPLTPCYKAIPIMGKPIAQAAVSTTRSITEPSFKTSVSDGVWNADSTIGDMVLRYALAGRSASQAVRSCLALYIERNIPAGVRPSARPDKNRQTHLLPLRCKCADPNRVC